ncbi:MAG: hypothetical protein P8Z37_00700 [Acidobacteriota bacterium]|jgi:hypothetical protein
MQALDTTIAYYLCSIMVVLAAIIAFGAARQKAKKEELDKK